MNYDSFVDKGEELAQSDALAHVDTKIELAVCCESGVLVIEGIHFC